MIFFTGKIPDINFALNKFVQIICPYFTGKEHHLTFTCESGELKGSYLTHSTLPLTGATGDEQWRCWMSTKAKIPSRLCLLTTRLLTLVRV